MVIGAASAYVHVCDPPMFIASAPPATTGIILVMIYQTLQLERLYGVSNCLIECVPVSLPTRLDTATNQPFPQGNSNQSMICGTATLFGYSQIFQWHNSRQLIADGWLPEHEFESVWFLSLNSSPSREYIDEDFAVCSWPSTSLLSGLKSRAG
jgi:hypothetical protein